MGYLIEWRWTLLIMAFVGAVANIWLVASPSTTSGPEFFLPIVTALQTGGTYGFAKYLATRSVNGGWPVFVGYAAAVLWIVMLLSGLAAQASGPGGLVIGMLVMLPALLLAPLFQIASLIGFWRKQQKAG